MKDIKRISEEQKREINTMLKPLGLKLDGCSITGNQASVTIDRNCAATYNCRRVVNMLKNSFGTKLSTIILDGREFVV